MKAVLIALVFCNAVLAAWAQYDPEKAWSGVSEADQNELLWLSAKGGVHHFRALKQARRRQLLTSWNKVLLPAGSKPDDYFLANLGDEQAMQRIAAAPETPNLYRCAWPEILIYVGPLLLRDDLIDTKTQVLKAWPVSFELSREILTFIGGEKIFVNDANNDAVPVLDEHGKQVYRNVRTEFNDETIEWARRTRSRSTSWGPPEPTVLRMLLAERELVRDWWRANAGHFQRHDFKAVRPGRELPEPKSATTGAQTDGDSQRSGENEQSTGSPASPLMKTASDNPIGVAVVTHGSHSSSTLFWVGVVTAVVLLAVLLFFWRRRARGRKGSGRAS